MVKRRAFTIVETLLTLGIIAVTTGLSVPMYRNFQIRSDLDLVTEQTIQGLRRAQILSQSGENNSAWGYYVQDGVLYQGDAYAVRDPEYDEIYPVPITINASGLSEVAFSRIDGIPHQIGEIILQALNGEQRIIVIGLDGVLSSSGLQGVGEIGGGDDSDSSAGASSASTSSTGDDGGDEGGSSSTGDDGGDEGGSSSDGGGDDGGGGTDGGGTTDPTCEDRFTVGADGAITTTGNVNATFEVLGSEITYGAGGPEVQVRIHASTNGGITWIPLFNEADVDGGETQTISNIPNGSQVLLKVNGRYSWLFNRTYESNDSDGHIEVLRNGDTPPEYEAFDNQEGLAAFLEGVLGEDGNISLGEYDAVFLSELGSLGGSTADFQDAVVKVTFSQPEGSCSTVSDARFKISFSRVENTGVGDAQNKVYVGEQGMIFGDSEWIPIKEDGMVILDNFLTETVPGLAVWRHNGYIRVLEHGSLPGGSKEIIDATVTFQNVTISSVVNDTGQNKTENPLDGIVNDGAGGDEVIIAADNQSVLYKTRVTVADDAILIHWQESQGAGVDDDSDDDSGDTGGDTGDDDSDSGDSDDDSGDSDDSGGGDLDDETPDPCAVPYTIKPNGQIVINGPADVTFHVHGSHMTYGTRGPEIRSYVSASFDNGSNWQSLFGFRDVDGGERQTFTDVASGTTLAVRAEGRYSWLFRNRADTTDGTGRVRMLRRGAALPGATPYMNVAGLQGFMRSIIQENRIRIGKTSILLLYELQELNENADHQDVAVEVIIEDPASEGICGGADYSDDSDDTSDDSGDTDDDSDDSGDTGGTDDNSDDTVDDGEKVTICHFPPGNRNNPQTLSISPSGRAAHIAHGDRDGACEEDADGDTIPNGQDLCPDTYTPEGTPERYMLFNRFALTSDSAIFRKGPRKKIGQFTLADTLGCSCEQLVDVAEGVKTYHFSQLPRLLRQVRSLFPFYTVGAREHGCGKAIINMVKNYR